jgi:hypothetical protein
MLDAYLAGLFDGEGCVSINSRYQLKCQATTYHLVAGVSNNDATTLRRLKRIYGFGSLTTQGKNMHWVMEDRQALSFLERIYPWLRIKSNVAWLGMCFQMHKQRETMRRLKAGENRKGVGVSKGVVEARVAMKELISKINKLN